LKKLVSAFLVLALFVSLGITATAEPIRITTATPKLSFIGTSANCQVTVKDVDKDIEATMSLWDGSTCLTSWSGSGRSIVFLSGSYEVESGKAYTLTVNGTIDGNVFSIPAVVKYCA